MTQPTHQAEACFGFTSMILDNFSMSHLCGLDILQFVTPELFVTNLFEARPYNRDM